MEEKKDYEYSTILSFRINRATLEKLNKKSEEVGKNRCKIINELIRKYLKDEKILSR